MSFDPPRDYPPVRKACGVSDPGCLERAISTLPGASDVSPPMQESTVEL